MNQVDRAEISVLYVDDEINNLNSFKATFRRVYNVFTAISAVEGRKVLDENHINIIITDQRMPNMTGVEFLESILSDYPDAIRILLTGYTDIQAVIDAINKGKVYQYITKPWDDTHLKVTIDNAYEIYDLRKKNASLMSDLLRTNDQLEFLLRQKMIS